MDSKDIVGSVFLEHEGAVRFGTFFGLLIVLAAIEALYPSRKRTASKPVRWYSNLALSAVNILALRALFPILAIAMASHARARGWGIFNNVEVPYLVAFALSILAFDFTIYMQHLVFHFVPVLWRLHRVHHSEVDLDVSSAVRFHFVESLISMGIKLGAVTLLGPPVLAVLAFEVWLNATSMFHHANVRIDPRVDRVLRWFIVTPDMHRIHHSVRMDETNSNFSFNLPWWDRLLGTYRHEPRAGRKGLVLGLDRFRGARDQHLDRLLLQPLMGEKSPPAEPEPSEAAESSHAGGPAAV